MTLVFAMALILPARLLWRRPTRPVERFAWSFAWRRAGSTRMNPRGLADRSLAGGPILSARVCVKGVSHCVRAATSVTARLAIDRFRGRIQSDLGFYLVPQYGKLGDRHLPEANRIQG